LTLERHTNEDPVTGGSQTFLAKYWSERLGKTKMNSFQASQLELIDEVLINSQAVIIFHGEISV
jgi:predicted PhzF superfamily epimerase YddE/YHI9